MNFHSGRLNMKEEEVDLRLTGLELSFLLTTGSTPPPYSLASGASLGAPKQLYVALKGINYQLSVINNFTFTHLNISINTPGVLVFVERGGMSPLSSLWNWVTVLHCMNFISCLFGAHQFISSKQRS